jgi:DnaJ-class molecular chaperone
MQWHPDVSKEPDAKEQFQAINFAYSILSDDIMKRKYDAGLALEASLRQPVDPYKHRAYNMDGQLQGYRSPFRCGWICGEGKASLGRFTFTKILGWEDIKNDLGQTMISSWPKYGDSFVVEWR